MVKEKTKKCRAFIKILSCVLIISALASIFIISSSAEESYVLDGAYAFNQNIDFSVPISEIVTFSLLYAPEYVFESMMIQDGETLIYSDLDTYDSVGVASNLNGVATEWQGLYNFRYLVFDNVTVSAEFYSWFTQNAGNQKLSGTYFFNDRLTYSENVTAFIPFSYVGSTERYDLMSFGLSENNGFVFSFLNSSTGVYATPYVDNGIDYSWSGNSYRYITFEETVVSPDFYSLVNSNALKVSSDLKVLNGTYEFPDVLPENGAFMSNITFDYGGVTYVSFNFERGTLYFGVGGREFVTVYDNTQGGWLDKKSITFNDVVVTSDFADNFNYLINYGQTEEPEPDNPIVPEPDPDPDQSLDYNSGYNDGYYAGYNAGYEKGLDEGYLSGYDKGYAEGYTDHQNKVDTESLGQDFLSDIFSAPIKALDSIVLLERNALDGTVVTITLWSIFSTILVVAFVVWIIKIFF